MNKNFIVCFVLCCAIIPVFAQPVITSFTPASGPIGTTVTITGANFNTMPANNIVYFGAVKAVVTAATATTLDVTVPTGATYDPITVTTGGLTAYSARPFIITFSGGGASLQGGFASKKDIGSNCIQSILGDIDGDGLPDVIATKSANIVSVYRNTSSSGTISFPTSIDYTMLDGSWGLATGDFDGDGKLDIAAAAYGGGTSGVCVFRNTSTPGAVSLAARIDYSTGNTSYSYSYVVGVGDLDGDGKPDMAIPTSDNVMTVYRNTSTGPGVISFGSKQNFPMGLSGDCVFFSDLDGDGKKDVVVCNSSINVVTIFRNTSTPGNISLVATQLPTGSGPVFAAADDLDNDGKNDLVVTLANDDMVAVFKNNSTPGNISFAGSSTNYPIHSYPKGVAINDVDGDGLTDLVVASNSYDSIYVFRHNNGNAISFDAPVIFNGNSNSAAVNIGDVDMDGAPDILTGMVVGSISVFRNTVRGPRVFSITPTYGGQGTVVTVKGVNFTNASAVSFGTQVASSYTVLNDTVIEAVVNGPDTTGMMRVVRVTGTYGTGSGPAFTFTNKPTLNSFTPLKGDTNTVVTLTGSNFSAVPANNVVYFGDARATVLSATTTLTMKMPAGASYKPITVTVGTNMVSSDRPFTPVFPGAPATFLATSFASKIDVTTGSAPGNVYTTDLDGDGKTDIISCNGNSLTVSVFRNTSTPGIISLSTKVDFATGSYPACVTTGDFDMDGKPDLVVGNLLDFTISVYKNTSSLGSISFAPKVDYSAGRSKALAVGDVDGDGKPDIVSSSLQSNGNLSVLLNTGNGSSLSFGTPFYISTGSNPRAIELHDLNKDGKPELILSNSSDDNVYVYTNTSRAGTVSFAGPYIYDTGDGPYDGLGVSDLDEDGLLDVVTCNYNGASISALKNTTTGSLFTFNAPLSFSTPVNPGHLALGDLDGDGKPDVATGSQSISVLKNASAAGSISFLPMVNYSTGYYASSVAVIDLDHDGKPELIAANPAGNTISIFRNKINEPLIVPSGASPVTGNVVARVTVDSSVQTHNGNPYVQRHYDIEPENNAATATATVTLYFSQQEFDNYNAAPNHGTDLPANPTDNANKANLRVYQYHGFSASSLPGTYSGTNVEIDPDDNNIVWNATAQWWEVTFNVTGFSGFFVGSAGNSILPLNLVSITGHRQNNQAIIEWVTKGEENMSHFVLQRSEDGRSFSSIAQVPATNNFNGSTYRYADEMGAAPVYYYRLLQVDKDNSMVTSKQVSVRSVAGESVVRVTPNPAKAIAWVAHPAAAPGARVLLVDLTGRVVKTIIPAAGSLQTPIELGGLPKGAYQVVFRDNSNRYSCMLVVE